MPEIQGLVPSPYDRSAIVEILPSVMTAVKVLWSSGGEGAAPPEDRVSGLPVTTTLGFHGADSGHCRLGQAPAGCPRGAILLVITGLLLTAPVLPSDCHFFCKHFHFLLGSQYPTELSKEHTEPPLYVGDGIVDRPVHGTKLLLREGTRPSCYVCAFHSTKLFCCQLYT